MTTGLSAIPITNVTGRKNRSIHYVILCLVFGTKAHLLDQEKLLVLQLAIRILKRQAAMNFSFTTSSIIFMHCNKNLFFTFP